MSQEAKWYVVHTYSGYENKVKEDLEKSVENLGLQDTILVGILQNPMVLPEQAHFTILKPLSKHL